MYSAYWKDIFLKNSKGENLQMLRYWFYIQYNAEKNGKKYVSRSLALSESAIEYVYRGIPKRMEVLQDLFAQMKQMKLVKEDVVKNEIVVRPAKLEGLEIKNYIKDKPVDLMSFNYIKVVPSLGAKAIPMLMDNLKSFNSSIFNSLTF